MSSHYRSALQLLTSAQASGTVLTEDQVSDRLTRQLVRDGRPEDALTLSHLLLNLKKASSDILRNRAAVLTLLSSLAARRGSAPPISAFSTPLQIGHGSKSSGFSSITTPGLSTIHHPANDGYHPPVPPKPRSRPNSGIFQNSEIDGTGTASVRHFSLVQQTTITEGRQQTIPGVRPATAQTSEEELVRDLVFVFQGIEGSLIRRQPGSQKFCLSREASVSAHQATLTLKLAELGWLYTQVHGFTERQADQKEYGLVGQSFVTALREELTEYYRLLAVIEGQVREGGVTLLQLSVWATEPMRRLRLLVELVTACGSCRGGSLASCLYSFLNQGDPGLRSCVASLLTAACRPLYTMLIRWILDGSLEDPHHEFFVGSEPGVQGEAIWHHKYSVRKAMIPRFITYAWSKKILSTGKSINFLSSVCKDSSTLIGRHNLLSKLEQTDPASLFSCDVDNPLLQVAGEAYRLTARHVLDIMFNKFHLMAHLAALRKYLLLGQGDIMRYLLNLLETELSQPATQLYPHNLAGILETAIRSTNSQYESSDILERLDVRLLEIQAGDTGWDVFSLDYKVTGPIGVVFTPDTMNRYLMLFNTLWRAKRMEWVLSKVWKRLATLHKMVRVLRELAPVLHMANLLASEMIHFVHQMAYYITFEVMECGWDRLVKQIDTAESLEDVIQAHEEFLCTLLSRSLLDDRGREMLTQLRAIYDRILEFQGIQDRLHEESAAEFESRLARERAIQAKTTKGGYGTSADLELQDEERRKSYAKSKLGSLKAQLKIVSQSYQDMVRTFLFQLTCSNDESLQCLSFRLDFNQHYKRKDSRLSRPLTFSHRRLSGFNQSMSSSQLTSQLD